MAMVARDSTRLPVLSTVGWFSRLPELPYAVGSVALPTCRLALAAVRALCVMMRGDIQNGRRHATIADEPAGVGQASPWPRCGVPVLRCHDGPSVEPVRYKRCSAVPRSLIRGLATLRSALAPRRITCVTRTSLRRR